MKHLAILALFALAEGALACATCGGPADAPQTHGMNAAILTLFGVLCIVGITAAIFIGVIARRIARHDHNAGGLETTAAPTMATLES